MYRLYKSIQYLLYPDYIRDVHVESDTMVFLVHGRIGRSWYGNTDGLSNEGQYLRTLVQPGERITISITRYRTSPDDETM